MTLIPSRLFVTGRTFVLVAFAISAPRAAFAAREKHFLNVPIRLQVEGDEFKTLELKQLGNKFRITLLRRENSSWTEQRSELLADKNFVQSLLNRQKEISRREQALLKEQKFKTDILEKKLSLYRMSSETSIVAETQLNEMNFHYARLRQNLWLNGGKILVDAKGNLIAEMNRKKFILMNKPI